MSESKSNLPVVKKGPWCPLRCLLRWTQERMAGTTTVSVPNMGAQVSTRRTWWKMTPPFFTSASRSFGRPSPPPAASTAAGLASRLYGCSGSVPAADVANPPRASPEIVRVSINMTVAAPTHMPTTMGAAVEHRGDYRPQMIRPILSLPSSGSSLALCQAQASTTQVSHPEPHVSTAVVHKNTMGGGEGRVEHGVAVCRGENWKSKDPYRRARRCRQGDTRQDNACTLNTRMSNFSCVYLRLLTVYLRLSRTPVYTVYPGHFAVNARLWEP